MGEATDLHEAELTALAARVIPPDATEPFGVYMFSSDEPAAELGRYVERVVFLEAFGNTAELLEKEYEPYEPASMFLCVIDQMRKRPAGVMRIVRPSDAGFKSLNDLASTWGEPAEDLLDRTGMGLDLDSTWDIATLAVAPDYRGKATMGLVAMGLYQGLGLSTIRCGIDWWVAILDVPVLRMIRWKLHVAFTGYKGTTAMPYLGSSASMPVWCDVCSTRDRMAVSVPELSEIYWDGVGLEPAMRPLDMGFAERLVA